MATYTFTNNAPIVVPKYTKSSFTSPYPVFIPIDGLVGKVENVTVSLSGVTFTWTNDLIVLLANTAGPIQKHPKYLGGDQIEAVELLSGCGGSGSIANVNLVFDSTAPAPLPPTAPIVSGTYQPSVNQNAAAYYKFKSPAPLASATTGKYSTDLGIYKGMDLNGSFFQIFVDNANYGATDSSNQLAYGQIDGGVTITITTI